MGEGGSLRRTQILGLPIDPLTMDAAIERVERAIQQRSRLLIGVVNAAKLVNLRRDGELRDAVLACDMLLADGMSVVWAGRLLRRRLPERVTGIDLMLRMLEVADRRGYRVFFLGATEEVLSATVARIRREYPGVCVAGARNGYFGGEEESRVAAQIATAQPDMLLVAMSSPNKELFLRRWSSHMDVPVLHGVGGAFDVYAGKVRRAPPLWQRRGMEWFYRVLQEPRRLWKRYLVTNTLFTLLVLRELLLGPLPLLAAESMAGGPARLENRQKDCLA